jgi:hypothetical protein
MLDGLDLHTEENRALAAYHGHQPAPILGEFFEDETKLAAAFARHRKSDECHGSGSTKMSCVPVPRQML